MEATGAIMLKKMAVKWTVAAMAVMAAGLSAGVAAAVVSSNGAKLENPVTVGQVASVELVAPRAGSRIITSRVKTVEGRNYYAYGVMQGMEGTQLTIETARNGVRYLCGGLPRNCNALAE